MRKLSCTPVQKLHLLSTVGYGNKHTALLRPALTVLLASTFVMLLSSCSWFGNGVKEADTVDGALVYYAEKEPGGESFKTRIFVTKDYLHLSDDRKAKGFILYDRRKKIIYNVNDEDKTIMVIEAAAVKLPPPIDIKYEEVSQPSGAIPAVDGNKATHYRYTANGKQCYNVVSLGAKFIPDLSIAMSEFRTVLAGEHAKTLANTPKDMLDACDLALNVFHPIDHLKNGFPLREWSSTGYSRFIIYYRITDKMKLMDLELPDGYERYSVTKK